MQKNNLISVIIPVHNCEKYLATAIESVLYQTYKNIEIIIIDDGSTDNTAKIACEFKPNINYYYQDNQGAAAARNKGIHLATGDFIAFLDADDIWLKNKLIQQTKIFKNQDIDCVFSLIQQFHSPELTNKEKAKIKVHDAILTGYSPGTMLIKKNTFFKIGGFATNLRMGEFIDWYLRAKEKGLKEFMLNKILMKRRLHSQNMGLREKNARSDYIKIIKASLDRRQKEK